MQGEEEDFAALIHAKKRVNGFTLPLSPVQGVSLVYIFLSPLTVSTLLLPFIQSMSTLIILAVIFGLLWIITFSCGMSAALVDVGKDAIMTREEKRENPHGFVHCSICMTDV